MELELISSYKRHYQSVLYEYFRNTKDDQLTARVSSLPVALADVAMEVTGCALLPIEYVASALCNCFLGTYSAVLFDINCAAHSFVKIPISFAMAPYNVFAQCFFINMNLNEARSLFETEANPEVRDYQGLNGSSEALERKQTQEALVHFALDVFGFRDHLYNELNQVSKKNIWAGRIVSPLVVLIDVGMEFLFAVLNPIGDIVMIVAYSLNVLTADQPLLYLRKGWVALNQFRTHLADVSMSRSLLRFNTISQFFLTVMDPAHARHFLSKPQEVHVLTRSATGGIEFEKRTNVSLEEKLKRELCC